MEFVRRFGSDDRINPGTWVGGYLDEHCPEGEDEGYRCARSECHRKYEISPNGISTLLIVLYLPVMGLLRMIKLFGWENRVKESVGEKREEELRWVWKGKLLGMISDIAKCVVI